MKQRESVIMAVDVVVQVINTHPFDKATVLVQRGKGPFTGSLVLPGGHVEAGETALVAATRELYEETGIKLDSSRLVLACVLDDPKRDPRPGRRVSLVYKVQVVLEQIERELKAGSDAAGVVVCDPRLLKRACVGFDHYTAIAQVFSLHE